jgi:hypothetical protein
MKKKTVLKSADSCFQQLCCKLNWVPIADSLSTLITSMSPKIALILLWLFCKVWLKKGKEKACFIDVVRSDSDDIVLRVAGFWLQWLHPYPI